jgi:Rrf2 family protein
MFLSHSCNYALQTMLWLARRKEASLISIKNIARENNISYYFLAKVLQKLTKVGLLDSYRGLNGGVKLGKRAKDITVLEIIEAIDGLEMFEKCIIGLPTCNRENDCALHKDWQKIINNILDGCLNKNLYQLI